MPAVFPQLKTVTGTPVQALLVLASLVFAPGCMSTRLNQARQDFRATHYEEAAARIDQIPGRSKDRLLLLLERGMMHQAAGQYRASLADWAEARDVAEALDVISVSRDTPTLAVNDVVGYYRASEYEVILMHTLAAQSYLALAEFEEAAVEARNAIYHLERLGDELPTDPYARYVAGLCLELMRDYDAAAVQYRLASEPLLGLAIDPTSGAMCPVSEKADPAGHARGADPASSSALTSPPGAFAQGHELVLLLGIASSIPGGQWPTSTYAEIRAGDLVLGRTYLLTDRRPLREAWNKQERLAKAVKKGARIALKEGIAQVLDYQEDGLGDIARVLLFSLEVEDDRQWRTAPEFLHVARVPCPADLKEFSVVLINSPSGSRPVTVTAPLVHQGRSSVSFLHLQ